MNESKKPTKAQKKKLKRVFSEWEDGKLHSGSKDGPIVKSHKQAIAIGLSVAGMSRKDSYWDAYAHVISGISHGTY